LSSQVIQILNGHYKLEKTISSAITQQEIDKLVNQAQYEIGHLKKNI